MRKKTKLNNNTSGFTIIEVALVLAIAGLIFLVVFLALPALQNSQKDTAAREDVGRVVSAIAAYKTDNSGTLPAGGSYTPGTNNGTFSGYIGKLSNGESVTVVSSGVAWATTSLITIIPSALCGTNSSSPANYGQLVDITIGDSNTRSGNTVQATSSATVVKLSSGNYYCQDS